MPGFFERVGSGVDRFVSGIVRQVSSPIRTAYGRVEKAWEGLQQYTDKYTPSILKRDWTAGEEADRRGEALKAFQSHEFVPASLRTGMEYNFRTDYVGEFQVSGYNKETGKKFTRVFHLGSDSDMTIGEWMDQAQEWIVDTAGEYGLVVEDWSLVGLRDVWA